MDVCCMSDEGQQGVYAKQEVQGISASRIFCALAADLALTRMQQRGKQSKHQHCLPLTHGSGSSSISKAWIIADLVNISDVCLWQPHNKES